MNWSTLQVEARADEVLVDADGDYEQLRSFSCVLEELLTRRGAASVMGEQVQLVSVRPEGLSLRAKVCRAGRTWDRSLLDLSARYGLIVLNRDTTDGQPAIARTLLDVEPLDLDSVRAARRR